MRLAGGRRVWAIVLATVTSVFVALSSVLFVWPPTASPRHVDAILSLNGPDEGGRRAEAIDLAERGYAPVLLFSQGILTPQVARATCPQVPGVKVVCFSPKPARTAGEVAFAAHYLESHRLGSVMVVPGRSQAIRARLLMERCFSGHVVVVGGTEQLRDIPGAVFYEWGAMMKALLIDRGC